MTRVAWHLSALLVVFLVASLLPAAPLSAQSTTTLIDFETGVDREPIRSSIPGLRFSNSKGNDWLYGDVRTGNYNAPYPNNCPDFDGQCAYNVSGNFFAWMGQASGDGKIDFTAGDATRFEADFSTAEELKIEAYDQDGAKFVSVTVDPNIRTGNFGHVRIEAPSGKQISSIVIKGSQNRWLMDNLLTDASASDDPPSEPEAPSKPDKKKHSHSASVKVYQRVTPNRVAARNGIVHYHFASVNPGRGDAKRIVVRMNINVVHLHIIDADFGSAGGWISKIGDDYIEFEFGRQPHGGDTLTANIRFRVSPDAPNGTQLGGRVTYRWYDDNGGGSGQSNDLSIVVGDQEQHSDQEQMEVERDGEGRIFTCTQFIPREPVVFWYNTPDGKVVQLESIEADDQGKLVLIFKTKGKGLHKGRHSMVGRGHWSGIIVIGEFVIDDDEAEAGAAEDQSPNDGNTDENAGDEQANDDSSGDGSTDDGSSGNDQTDDGGTDDGSSDEDQADDASSEDDGSSDDASPDSANV